MHCSCIYCTDTLTYSMFSCSHALQNWGNENICMYKLLDTIFNTWNNAGTFFHLRHLIVLTMNSYFLNQTFMECEV